MEEFACAIFFSRWPVFLFTVKAVLEMFFLKSSTPPPKKKSQMVRSLSVYGLQGSVSSNYSINMVVNKE